MYNVLKNNTFFYDKLYTLFLFTKVLTIRSTITSLKTVYMYKSNQFGN